MTKLLTEYIDTGDSIRFGDIQMKRLDTDSTNPRLTVVYSGDPQPHTVLRKRVDENHTEIQFPPNSTVLGLSPNTRGQNAFVWYAVPEQEYNFNIEVNE